MSRRTWNIIGIVILMGITSLVSVFGYIYFVGGSGEASQPISAATLEATPSANSIRFQIVPDESEVRFTLTEDLNGQPNTVVGRTDQVAGDIIFELDNPVSSRVGAIRINARTLTTDSEFRNRAIRAEILESSQDQYEFIDFTPTIISGLPSQIAVGEAVNFYVTGDLKIRNISIPVTFEVTATLVDDNRLEGTATAQITRSQYNLEIPDAPGVSNVVEEVTLEIDFVAAQVED